MARYRRHNSKCLYPTGLLVLHPWASFYNFKLTRFSEAEENRLKL